MEDADDSLFDFERFDRQVTVYRNAHGVQFYQEHWTTKYRGIVKYHVLMYAKRTDADEDCACGFTADEDSSSSQCRCNWTFTRKVSGKRGQTFREVLTSAIAEANSVVRCENCTVAHVRYKDFTQCTSCFVQSLVDSQVPVIAPCTICFDDIKRNASITLPCGHVFHDDCVKRLHKKECPLCRGPVEPTSKAIILHSDSSSSSIPHVVAETPSAAC